MQRITQTGVVRASIAAVALAAMSVGSVSAEAANQPGPPAGDQPPPQVLIGVLPAPAVPAGEEGGQLPPVPDRLRQPTGPFTMSMEVLASASPSQFGLVASPGCVTDSVYKRGMKVVFRFEVFDMDNRVRLTGVDGSTAQVTLPDGTILPAVFAPRGAPGTDISQAPWTWVTTWQVPTDFPLGPVMYVVDVASPDGRISSIVPASLPGQPVVEGQPLFFGGTYPTIIP